MRRPLVLTNESARHPFRAMFVHSERLERDAFEAAHTEMLLPKASTPSRLREDLSFFVLSYVSGLIIFSGMIV